MSEKNLHRAVCDYLRYQYPNVLFNSDLAGSMKLTIGQAVALKNLRSNRGFPDITIYEPRHNYHGLFIELKKEGEKLFKKDGTPVSDHLTEQIKMLELLIERKYVAKFAIGFDQAKNIIDDYFK
jgi:hypothetical protein